MTILGIAEAAVAPLIRSLVDVGVVSPGHSGAPPPSAALDRDGIAERFARAAWCCVAEPGDRAAGFVVRVLGAVTALERVLARVRPAALADELVERAAALPGEATSSGGLDVDELEAALARWSPRLAADDVLRSLGQAARFGVGLAVPSDPLWPSGLADLGDYGPHALWLRGDPSRLGSLERSIALVGARAATGYGEHVAAELSAGLVDRGYAVLSGAAYGIDGVAHRAALASKGRTVAILAGGLDRFYPSGHEELIGRIAEHGLVISEVPCGTAPTRWRFLQRNRLIAAAALATVVVEAGWRSGSINTANHALALGRPVGAVPGPVTSSASAGCHRMLRDSPTVCVTSAAEAAELAPLPESPPLPLPGETLAADRVESASVLRRDPDELRPRLLDALSTHSARSIERIALLSGLAVDRVQAELGLLEVEGAVRRRADGWTRAGQT